MKIPLFFILMLNACAAFTQTTCMRVTKKDHAGNITSEIYPIGEIQELRFAWRVGTNDFGKWTGVLEAFTKLKCYPNPSAWEVTIEYELPETGPVNLTICDNQGKLIKNELFKDQITGRHQYVFTGKDMNNRLLPGGVYHCKVLFKNEILSNKIVLIK